MKRFWLLAPTLLIASACAQVDPTVTLMGTFLDELNSAPDQAYEMTSQDFRAETSLEELTQFRDAYSEIKDFKKIVAPKTTEDYGVTTLTGDLLTTTGESRPFESVWLEKEGDWWLVHFELK